MALLANSTFIGGLNLLLTRAPDRIRSPFVNFLTERLGADLYAKFIKFLRLYSLFLLLKKINRKLNDIALNYWTLKARKDDWTWSWEICVITGGCSGIGKEIVKELLKRDVRVAVLDIQPLPVELKNKRRVLYVKCDVTSPTSVAEAAKAVRKELGDPSILINNAGVGVPHCLLDTTNEWVTKIFQINIISHFYLVKEFLPHMIKKNKGHIVGLASMASFVAPPGIVDYASTKAAVLAFHEGLTQEIKHVYRTPGVLNSVIHPSWVRTPLVAGHEDTLEKSQGKLMKPENIAKQVCDQIWSCRGGQLIIPWFMRSAPGIRGHPNWIQEIIRDLAVGKAASKEDVFQWSENKK